METVPHVVLVEDDASIRQFVAMALEESPVTLTSCESIAEAVAALERAPAALVITDLMLRGESGMTLIERLVAEPELRRGAAIAVFSAGLNNSMRSTLEGRGISRFLQKPVSLRELRACVEEAIGAVPAPPSQISARRTVSTGSPHDRHAARAAAVDVHFAGDASLYDAFLASTVAQFKRDVEAGDFAVQHGDTAALRRLAHSLKSVLKILGIDGAAARAALVERACESSDVQTAHDGWFALRSELDSLATPEGQARKA